MTMKNQTVILIKNYIIEEYKKLMQEKGKDDTYTKIICHLLFNIQPMTKVQQ